MINIADMEAEAAGVLPNRSIYFGTTDAEGSVEKAKSLWATVIVEPTGYSRCWPVRCPPGHSGRILVSFKVIE